MTVGISSANLAQKWLETLKNTSFAAGATLYVHLHTADPGATGVTSASQNTDGPGKAITWGTYSAGSLPITTTLPSWTLAGLSAPTSETITHMAVRTAATALGGTFLYSFAVTNKTVSNGDVLNLTAHSISLSPIAA